MRTRNALLIIAATWAAAAVAGAQQPTSKPATRPRTTAAAKSTAKTAAATALPVTPDSARKVVMARAADATIASVRLHRSGAKPYYAVSYRVKGDKKTMHANVDANTGAFSAPAPAATSAKPSSAKTPVKKPS